MILELLQRYCNAANVYEILAYCLSDKFTAEEQIEILSVLFSNEEKDCKDRLDTLLKHNEEAARFVANHVIDNAKLSETLYPIALEFIKHVGAEKGKSLLERLTRGWNIKVVTLLEKLLFGNNTKVHCIDMQISLNQINIIAYALKQNNTLLSLSLMENKIGDEEVKCIADVLKQLFALYLMQNQIGDEGAKYIADALAENNTLLELGLSWNYITSEGIKAIADALEKNNILSKLYISWNQIGHEGAKYIAGSLKINNTLSKLSLHSNQIGGYGAKFVADVLKINKTLSELGLDNNQIGNYGAKYIAEALKKNNTLSNLLLGKTSVGTYAEYIFEAVLSSGRTTTFYCDMFTTEQQNQVNEQINANCKCKRGYAARLRDEKKVISGLRV